MILKSISTGEMFDPGRKLDECAKKLLNLGKMFESKDEKCNASSENFRDEEMPFDEKELQKEIELSKNYEQSEKTVDKLEEKLANSEKNLFFANMEKVNLQERISFLEGKCSILEREVSRLQSLNDEYLRYNKQQNAILVQQPEGKQEIETTLLQRKKTGRKVSSDTVDRDVVSSSVKSPDLVPLYQSIVPAENREDQLKNGFPEKYTNLKSHSGKDILDSNCSKGDTKSLPGTLVVPLYQFFVPAENPEDQLKGFSEKSTDLKSHSREDILDSKCDSESPLSPLLVENHFFEQEVDDFEFDLAEMKKRLGLLDIDFAPLSPIPSPVKPKKTDHDDLYSYKNSHPPRLSSYTNSAITTDSESKLDVVINNDAAVHIKTTDTSEESAKEVDSIPLKSAKGKRSVSYDTNKQRRPLRGPSFCFKRRKLLKSDPNSIAQERSSLELHSARLTDFIADNSSVKTNSSSSTNSSQSSASAPASSQDLSNDLVALNHGASAFKTPEVTSHCALKPKADSSKAVDSVVAASQSSIVQQPPAPTSYKAMIDDNVAFKNPAPTSYRSSAATIDSKLKSSAVVGDNVIVQNKSGSSSDSAENDYILESAQERRRISHFNKSCGPSSGPSGSKRQKLLASTPYNYSSSEFHLTRPTAFKADKSPIKASRNNSHSEQDVSNSCSLSTSSLSSHNAESKTTVSLPSRDLNNNSKPSSLGDSTLETLQATSHCVSKQGVDGSETVDSVVTAARSYNVQRGHSLNMKGKGANKKKKNILDETKLIEDLSSLKCSTFGSTWSKQAVRTLVNVLINPKLIPDKTNLLLQVFCFIRSFNCGSDLNSTAHFSLLDVEKAVICSLRKVDRMNRHYLKDLLASATESIHHLIANKPDMRQKELQSLCKIFTEICKERNLPQKPVLLVADFLKMRHKYSALMIASIVGVWSEPLKLTESMSDEEKCFHCAIAFGASKKASGLAPYIWNSCAEFLSQHIAPAPDTEVVKEVLNYLFAKIHLECSNGSPPDMEYTLLTAVIIFAAFSEWDWAKENILGEYVIPSLKKYGVDEPNETAFGVFSYLYAEIFSYCPGKPDDCELKNYFKCEGTFKAQSYVKDWAAVALIRLLVLQKKAISKELLHWLQENVQNSKAESLKSWLKRKKITLTCGLTKEAILI